MKKSIKEQFEATRKQIAAFPVFPEQSKDPDVIHAIEQIKTGNVNVEILPYTGGIPDPRLIAGAANEMIAAKDTRIKVLEDALKEIKRVAGGGYFETQCPHVLANIETFVDRVLNEKP